MLLFLFPSFGFSWTLLLPSFIGCVLIAELSSLTSLVVLIEFLSEFAGVAFMFSLPFAFMLRFNSSNLLAFPFALERPSEIAFSYLALMGASSL